MEQGPKIREILSPQAGSAPSLVQAAEALGLEKEFLAAFMSRALQAGLVLQIAKNRYLPVTEVRRFAVMAEALEATSTEQGFTAADYRDKSGLGRNLVIALLEYFDRTGFTRRIGDYRRIRRTSRDAFGGKD